MTTFRVILKNIIEHLPQQARFFKWRGREDGSRLPFRSLLFICILTCSASVTSAPYGFKSYMTVDGLSDNRVLCGLQDSYGFLWLGTANGLNCYDGQRNIVYRNMIDEDVAFENNQITALLEQDGDIWFGGAFGLYVYRRLDNSFTRFDKATRYGVLVSSTVDKMARTQNGLIWIGTQGQGLFLYDPATGTLTQDSRHNGFISDLTIAADGFVYLVSLDGQLLVYDQEGHFQRQYEVPGFVVDKSRMCVEHVGSRLFVGCDKGLFRLNTETNALDRLPVRGDDFFVRSLMERDGDLLLGTDHGLYAYSLTDGFLSRYDDPTQQASALSDDCVNALLTTDDGTLCVLTDRGGLNVQPSIPQGLAILPLPVSANSLRNRALAICPTHDGRLWVGAEAGLYVQEPGEDHFHQPRMLHTQITGVSALVEDDDDLWIGTQNAGLYVLNTITGALRHYTYSADRPYTIASNEVYSLLRTRRGDIYVGTSWGLRLFDRSQEHFMFFSEISSMTGFTAMEEDLEGNVWAASDSHGLFVKRADKAFQNYLTHADQNRSLPDNAVTSVVCDSHGTIWIATKGGGLCRYAPATDDFERFGAPDSPLQREQVYFVQEDAAHNLWLGCENGFVRINADGSLLTELHHLTTNDRREQNPWNASCLDANGRVYAGGNGEIVCITPDKVRLQTPHHPVYISSITFPNTDDSQAELNRLHLNHPLYITDAIRLPFTDNHFTLHFASPRYGSSVFVHYEYMMEGFDKTWARGSDNREATYSNLPPGTYTFLLREAGDNVPEHYARLRITVLSPWYSTPWAYALYALALAALVYFIYSRTKRKMRRNYEAQMEDYRLRQEKENFQSKINFFINLVHEIRTPLSLINLPLEQMEEGELSDDNRNHVHAIRRNTNYLLGITNQLLDFQKAETEGKIQLQLSTCDVSQLLDGIYRQFKDPMKVKGLSLQLQLPQARVVTTLDRDKVSKVLMNLLGNALKYAHSEVILRLEQTAEDRFAISVIDDGPGVPLAERERIFDVYYQIAGDATAAHLGTGLGLSYAKMLATAHGGDIRYADAVGGGSDFTLILPIRHDQTATSAVVNIPGESAGVSEGSKDSENADSIANSRSFRILLVEDNDELLRATAEGLRKWFHVMKAHDGVEALDILHHHDMDVIVSDVMMPRMDGNELCRQLKSDINYSHLPVILLTAKTTVEAKLEGMQSGADIYLEKPFSMRQLHLQINSLLRMRQRFYERMRQVEGAEAALSLETDFGLNQQDIQFMERLQELVRQNMRDEQFSIDILAEQMNMSRSSFYRKIKALTDMTPVDYMKTQRLERAAALLRQGQRITEVADQVGFTSSSYFAKCFRAKYGVLPKDYITSLRDDAERTEKQEDAEE